ncbi:DUF6783 domain-containing protein [Fusicatenibacter saccharivorans]
MKKAFRKLRVPVCGRFCPNRGGLSPLRQPNEGCECYSSPGTSER